MISVIWKITFDNTKYLSLDVFYIDELYQIAEGVANYIIVLNRNITMHTHDL